MTAPTVVPQATESYQPLRAAALKAQRDQWRAQNPGQTNYRMIDDGAAEEAKWGRVPAGFKGDPNGGLRFKSQGLSAARVQAQPARKPRMSFGRPGR